MIQASVEPRQLELGRRVELTVTLTNIGAGPCTNLVFSLKLPGQLLLLRGTGRIETARLEQGERRTLAVRVRPQEVGTWPLTSHNFSYQDPRGRSRRIDDWCHDIRVLPATSPAPEATPPLPGDRGRPRQRRIFISYRRQDAGMAANWLAEELLQRFGGRNVFIDAHSIKPGMDFRETIMKALGRSVVLLVVIGPAWTAARDARGRRRLDDPGDYVRLEVETALRRNIWLIPVLIDNAAMPRPDELPASMADLAVRNAKVLRTQSFKRDVEELVADLREHLRDNPDRTG